MKKPNFINGGIYHIYNRGVEKRDIFGDDRDKKRFLHNLFEFNDINPVINFNYHFGKSQSIEVRPRYFEKPRKLLVEIWAFCLMKNHYHLLLKQVADGGVVSFMQKMGTGYTMYFNKKYERVGPLFQGGFKAVGVENNAQIMYLPHYIHLNPLDFYAPAWKEKKIKNHKEAIQFLENYKWSSFLDYIGKKNWPSITRRDFILNLFDGATGYKTEITQYLKELELDTIKDLVLEDY